MYLEKKVFEFERGGMIVHRIRKLIESKSFEYALNFGRKALQAMRSVKNVQILRETISMEQHQFLQEVYYVLIV